MRCFTMLSRNWDVVSACPDPRLRPGVYVYRGFWMDLGLPRRRLEVPVGAVTLVLGFENELRVTDVAGKPRVTGRFRSLLAGLQTRARLGEHDGHLYGMEVVLAPWAAFRLFGVPMHQLSETVVDPEEVLGTKIRELTGALASLPGWEERFVLLDTVLSRWADHGPVCSPQVVWAWRELSRTSGTLSIARLAAETGWGPRHLENRFREQIGLSPKAAARVLRLRHALRLLVGGQAPNQVATACGFSDQAHFNREFKAMTGSSPGRFLADRMANLAGPMSYDRMAGQVTSVVLGT